MNKSIKTLLFWRYFSTIYTVEYGTQFSVKRTFFYLILEKTIDELCPPKPNEFEMA